MRIVLRQALKPIQRFLLFSTLISIITVPGAIMTRYCVTHRLGMRSTTSTGAWRWQQIPKSSGHEFAKKVTKVV
ncbi:hypothetical protein EDB19DRAFT_1707204 [Suillus lakei]|nr:hypothetical protein EDB19DRAFT_1707204 [Suillus lakei]